MRLCRESIRRAKVQLSLAAATEDSKQCFYKYIDNERRAKEVVHPSLGAGGNIVTKDMKKAEVPNTFFALVFYGQTSCSSGTEHSELENDVKQYKASTFWGSWSLTCHTTWTHTVVWDQMGAIPRY